MPTYVYECGKCGEELEVWQSFTDDPLKKHPSCGGKLSKVYQPVGIVLKGPGFYKTDSRNGKKSSTAADAGSSSDSGSSKDAGAKDSKSESKSDSKKPDSSNADSGKGAPKKADTAKAGSSASKSS